MQINNQNSRSLKTEKWNEIQNSRRKQKRNEREANKNNMCQSKYLITIMLKKEKKPVKSKSNNYNIIQT